MDFFQTNFNTKFFIMMAVYFLFFLNSVPHLVARIRDKAWKPQFGWVLQVLCSIYSISLILLQGLVVFKVMESVSALETMIKIAIGTPGAIFICWLVMDVAKRLPPKNGGTPT